ncbi:MAG: MucR family transcriptional regulator [Proteobacteria bacterium]|nr:MucR family transcriptional regulator [Pseudomonadota bacterium]
MNEITDVSASTNELLGMTRTIVASYVGNNQIPAFDVPAMVRSVHNALSGLSAPNAADAGTSQKPMVSIKKSVTPDYLICLEDGKRLKMLKRYLRSRYELTPEQYRVKWGLPADYPMVAPNYAILRSNFAKKNGLGRQKRVAVKRKKRA